MRTPWRRRPVGLLVAVVVLLGAFAPASPAAAQSGPADVTIGLQRLRAAELQPIGAYYPNAEIYDRLVVLDERFQIQPSLAERWELVDGTTWRFTLRRGVVFHDGSPFTAVDAAWLFDRIARQRRGGTISAVEGGTKVVDDYTVEFTPSRTNLRVPYRLVDLNLYVMKAGSEPMTAPVGTGPFRFVEFRPNELLRVARFDSYWNPAGAARVRSVTFRAVPDHSARLAALRAGDVDMVDEVPREAIRDLKADPRVRVVRSNEPGGFSAVFLNVTGEGEWGLTADRRMREAIARGIDRTTILSEVFEGNAEIGRTLAPPSVLGPYADRIQGGPAYDPARATAILEELGWSTGPDGIRARDGRRLELVLRSGYPSPEVHRPLPEVLQSQLRRIGIAVKIEEVDNQEVAREGEPARLHLWLEQFGQSDGEPSTLLRFFANPAIATLGWSAYNVTFGPGAAVDEPYAAALATADLARSQELAARGLAGLVDDEVAVIQLAATYKFWAVSPLIEGFTPLPAPNHEPYAQIAKR